MQVNLPYIDPMGLLFFCHHEDIKSRNVFLCRTGQAFLGNENQAAQMYMERICRFCRGDAVDGRNPAPPGMYNTL